jgi:hypothetical protein
MGSARRAYRLTGRQGWEVYGGPEVQGISEPPRVVLLPGACAPLLGGFVPAVGPPPGLTLLAPACAVLPAAPAVALLCAQVIDDVPARNAAITAARRTVSHITYRPVKMGPAVALSFRRFAGIVDG